MTRIHPPRRLLHHVGAAALATVSAASLAAVASPPAPSGLAFAVTLSQGGRSVSSDRFSLRVPGAKGTLVLTFEGIDLVGGTFASPVRLRNDTDADLLAVRVDLVSATETIRVSDAKGDVTRILPASAGPPPSWDSLPKGAESSGQIFRVGPVGFAPETDLLIVLGAVSGVAPAGSFEVEGAKNPAGLESDAAGSLYVIDATGKVFRTGGDGKKAAEVRNPLPPHAEPGEACAHHRAAGHSCRVAADGAAWAIEGRDISQFGADGRRVRSFRPGGEGPPVALAFGKDGRLYVATAGEEGRSGSIRVFRPF